MVALGQDVHLRFQHTHLILLRLLDDLRVREGLAGEGRSGEVRRKHLWVREHTHLVLLRLLNDPRKGRAGRDGLGAEATRDLHMGPAIHTPLRPTSQSTRRFSRPRP